MFKATVASKCGSQIYLFFLNWGQGGKDLKESKP